MLAEFLSEIVANKPSLEVYLLLWDFSLLYAAERELFPRLSLQWQTPPRVTLCTGQRGAVRLLATSEADRRR